MFFKRFRKKDPASEADLAADEALELNTDKLEEPSEPPADSTAASPELAEPAELNLSAAASEAPEALDPAEIEVPPETETPTEASETPAKAGFFTRMKQGLSRTSSNFAGGIGKLVLGEKEIDDELLEDIETQLLVADVGIEATTDIIDNLTERVARNELSKASALYDALKELLANLLIAVEKPLVINPENKPFVILVVGVNGVGKTTTIGKLAKRLQGEGKSVMLAAGDTFRAAAVEQLQVWGERNDIPVVAQHTGADSASVIFDAIQSAQSRQIDVVIADTAGRLHNKGHLMDELTKVSRVMGKLDSQAPHEVLLVLDAGTGQNALNQAEHFIQAAKVTGVALTKLDGTAKGGVIFALSRKFGLPVRFIGVGEGIDDLQPFTARSFIKALFDDGE